MKIFMVLKKKKKKKKKILFILLFSCFNASDIITDVTKQNRNIMTSTLSAYHKEKAKQGLFVDYFH